MGRYVVKRLIQMFLLFVVFLTVTFFLLQAMPGDIVKQQFTSNPNLPPEAKQIALERLGLDKPLFEQYRSYLINFFQLDFGFSWSQYPRPVWDIIKERLPRTVVLFTAALAIQYWVGFIAGKFLAWRRGKRGEMAVTLLGVSLFTVFYPWFALIMIWIFGSILGWFPVSKFLDPIEWRDAPFSANEVFITLALTTLAASVVLFVGSLLVRKLRERRTRRLAKVGVFAVTALGYLAYWTVYDRGSQMRVYAQDIGHHLILPVVTLTLVGFAGIMLLTRTSMLDTMKEDFILTARAKGLPDKQVRDRHAARTALLPVVTSLVLAVAAVIDGGIITETVFSWPGMGEILVNSVVSQDVPLTLAAFSFVGVMAVIGHLVADILYGVLDPRIRVTAQG